MIRASGLSRTFTTGQGAVEAVRDVDLDIGVGEIVGFLGPNGAGKTTTLRMLTTLLRPTRGAAAIAGHDLRADPAGVRRHIGLVAQGGGTNQSCTVRQELSLQARLYGAHARRVTEVCEELGLVELADRPVGALSGGQRRRLDIALGLVHEPAVLFLDEPTAGLDPQSRAELWRHVRRLRERHGTTVFLTTHYLEEADALADRVLIIDGGRIVGEGTPEELKRRVGGDIVTVEVVGDPQPARTGPSTTSSCPPSAAPPSQTEAEEPA